MLIAGRCHCGNIAFALTCEPDPATLPARACQCSFCTKHGAVWTALPSASLRVRVKEPGHATKYAFDTKTAQFRICTRCGIVPLVTSDIEGRLYAVVNSKVFEDFDHARLQLGSVDFDGEGEYGRLSRRKQHWIANVDYTEGVALTSEQSAGYG